MSDISAHSGESGTLVRLSPTIESAGFEIPASKRVAFGWGHASLSNSKPLRLSFDSDLAGSENPDHVFLRITVALDVRQAAAVEVSLADGAKLGVMDLRYACYLQMFELEINPEHLGEILNQGLELRRLDANEPLFVFDNNCDEAIFSPHLLIVKGKSSPINQFRQRMDSLACICEYGWMEGCVLDGLADMGFFETLDRHLDMFFAGDAMTFEDFYSRPADARSAGIESTSTIAQLARRRPGHSAIDLSLRLFESHTQLQGKHPLHATVAEANYTKAYPMAVIAKIRNDDGLKLKAIEQLRYRVKRLRLPEGIYLRHRHDGLKTYLNWSRGCAWYLLGMARTLDVLDSEDRPADLVDELSNSLDFVRQFQRPGGLWGAFLHESDTAIETSGSAGIATAMAIAARNNWGSSRQNTDSALKALDGLTYQLTPDGMLKGMSQSNKSEGAEDLQRGSFRVIGQCAMGMMAQLMGQLEAGSAIKTASR